MGFVLSFLIPIRRFDSKWLPFALRERYGRKSGINHTPWVIPGCRLLASDNLSPQSGSPPDAGHATRSHPEKPLALVRLMLHLLTLMPVLIVGSIALDDIKTQTEKRVDLMGGSASYASVSASFFDGVNLVGIVGSDFPQAHLDLFRQRQIDLTGLQIVDGKTFRWGGEYEADMNKRQTLYTELNVFETFTPTLPPAYRASSDHSCSVTSGPDLQNHVFDQVEHREFVVADTDGSVDHNDTPGIIETA